HQVRLHLPDNCSQPGAAAGVGAGENMATNIVGVHDHDVGFSGTEKVYAGQKKTKENPDFKRFHYQQFYPRAGEFQPFRAEIVLFAVLMVVAISFRCRRMTVSSFCWISRRTRGGSMPGKLRSTCSSTISTKASN